MGAGIICEGHFSLLRPNKTGEQIFKFGDHGCSFPELRIATMPVNINKKGRLYSVHGALSVKEGEAYKKPYVDKYTPEDGMGDRVEHVKAKKLIGFEELNAKGTILQKRNGEPA